MNNMEVGEKIVDFFMESIESGNMQVTVGDCLRYLGQDEDFSMQYDDIVLDLSNEILKKRNEVYNLVFANYSGPEPDNLLAFRL